MSEIPYSNRELDFKFGTIHDKLDLILVQTTKHNGRMSKIERRNSYVAGATAMVGIIVAPLAWWMFNQLQSVQASINRQDGVSLIKDGISRSLTQ